MGVLIFVSFAILLILTVPIGIALGLSAVIALLIDGSIPVEFIIKELTTSTNSFPLLAIPFFILAGEIMGKGGISIRLIAVAESLVGSVTGGLAMTAIVTSMFFAAISGSGPATVAAVGGLMIPAMVKKGYDIKFSTAVIASAGSIGVIIPPSIPMVMYGVSGSVSIGDMFMAGIVPGIMVGLGLMVYAYYYSKKAGYKGSTDKISFSRILKQVWLAKWSLLIPVIILGGIYGGIFTPTEAAAIAVFIGFIIGAFVYRELKFKDISDIFVDSALMTATILVIVGSATGFGKLLAMEQIPIKIADYMLSLSSEPFIIILLIIVLLLIVGCFMDTIAAIIILTPILLPIATLVGFDPIHFGIIMIISLAIGFITPPVGVNLFVGSSISGVSMESLSKAIVPFIISMIFVLLVVSFIPGLSLLFLD
ncbi:TRAP transporter large permease [Sporosarcina sp. P26b]|uniref:TRAP transporter large permease n=1 Tax=Sporosarcina TaxID=1569 RepID=UPI000A17BCFB|nr:MULTISPECIES: TRAP transporter large permease [Sporosarcina]ARK22029.1 C4-dicarboxylate ABC transporter permease [Sporosarcina ureae]PIC96341.1 TRAP transporter large permease [Sporosarcina sp. P26b]PIC98575.1 TRAP transporter large permease [Sporosarcina sp. P29]PID06002.1 TRAP transporter large permease [Sporosarcina sp. P30]PID09196.1 TRAP transporter large permease [Sporosarcina sp. P31]